MSSGAHSGERFRLEVGALEQRSISPDAPIIETATTSVGTVINQRTVQEIPLNGRHFVDLGLLIPGSVTRRRMDSNCAAAGQGSFGLNTAGGREDTVNFMINGGTRDMAKTDYLSAIDQYGAGVQGRQLYFWR
jgi:hypothetical protein